MKKGWKKWITAALSAVMILEMFSATAPMMARADRIDYSVLVQQDVPNWKDAITDAFGEGVRAGAAVTQSELSDKGVFALLTKHFNATTFGNELKPDCMFGYSNDKCPGTEEIVFEGKKMTVPVPNFSRADKMLQKLADWNAENPDSQIRVRGHVLLWHSQTPEWFFHVDYDKTKDYVDKATMNLRLEWYIKTVLEHYVGEDSPYKDMFYGWDVVNEATTDGGDVYRTDTENGRDQLSDSTHGSKSSWWHVYQSNEFIINAFKFANKYAPETLELYYNDYGEISPAKRERIKELIRAVKAEEGAPGVGTRMDAFGMQAHYGMGDFSIEEFEKSAREYAEAAGAIQLTELDFKASKTFDGTADTMSNEYVAQAMQYQAIFETLKKVAGEGVKITGITYWGTVDKYSWLQSNSNVGGGADGKQTQCPLLFDNDYQVKPAFWAFVDPTKIAPAIKRVQIPATADLNFARKPEYDFAVNSVEATFVPLWDAEGIHMKVSVTDKSRDDSDAVTVYAAKEGEAPVSASATRGDGKPKGGGYELQLTVPVTDLAIGQVIGLDVVVTDGNVKSSFNDIHNSQDTNTEYYAVAILKPEILPLPEGTPTVDGVQEELWKTAVRLPMMESGDTKAQARTKMLWDGKKLYLLVEVADKEVTAADAVQVFLDGGNEKASEYDKNDGMYEIAFDGTVEVTGRLGRKKSVESQVTTTENGYLMEIAIDWNSISPRVHNLLGLDVRVKDCGADEQLKGYLSWSNAAGDVTLDPSNFGTVKFAVAGEPTEDEEWVIAEEEPEVQEEAAEQTIEMGTGSAAIWIICIAAAALAACSVLYQKKFKNK